MAAKLCYLLIHDLRVLAAPLFAEAHQLLLSLGLGDALID